MKQNKAEIWLIRRKKSGKIENVEIYAFSEFFELLRKTISRSTAGFLSFITGRYKQTIATETIARLELHFNARLKQNLNRSRKRR